MSTSANAAVAQFNRQLQSIERQIAQGELRTAAAQLNILQRQAPQNPVVYILGMRLGEAAGNTTGALASAQRAVDVAPGWAVALVELAACQARAQQPDAALASATQAVAQAPQDLSVLARAIDVAVAVQRRTAALPWLEKAIALQPENRVFRRHYMQALLDAGRVAEANAESDALIAADPADPGAISDRLLAATRLGDTPTARAMADRLLAIDPENESYQFRRAAAYGETPATQPRELVAGLFDDYAPRFDRHLVQGLRYDTPRTVAAWIRQRFPALDINILDLGCGTGLLGAFLGPIQGGFVGVDLSKKMVEQAARFGVYDKFHLVDVKDALRETPAALYHVITANDVFVYVGDLSQAIPDAWRILRPDGYFIFTCEQADETGPDLVLRDSMRYAHKLSHVQALCRAAGFDDVAADLIDVRLERGAPIRGFRITAHKPADAAPPAGAGSTAGTPASA